MAFYDNLSQQYSAFTDPFGREEEDAVGNARPVTQTIRTDPLTPTVAQPVQPTGAGAFLGEYADMAPPMAQPQMGMAQPQMAPPMAPEPQMAPQMAQPAQPAPGYDPESIAQVLQQAGLNYAPPQPVAAVAQAPTSDVNPPAVSQQPQPTQAGAFLGEYADMAPAAAPAAPVAPTVDPGAALTRQAESGGDYNIGYNRAGTTDAFGAYQILSSTYREIQKIDPYFADKDQRTLTPEEQDRANQVIRNQNTKALQSQGIEPSESNLQLAHFLGAKGAADYLTTGYISPAAEAANGGPVKAREIAEKFLALGRGPNVAGVGREMGMGEPGYGGGTVTPQQTQQLNAVNQAFDSGDEKTLYRMAGSDDPQVSGPARSKLKTLMDKQKGAAEGEQLIADGKTTDLSRHLTSKNKEGSWVKYYLLNRLGLAEMAKEEAQLLGAGTKMTTLSDTTGKQYSAEVDGNGVITKAWDDNGKEISSKQTLANLQSSAMQKGERGQATGTRVRDAAGTEWSQVPTTRGMIFYNNKGERGVPAGKTVPIGIGSDIQLQGQLQTQKKQIDLAWDPIIKAATTGAGGIAEYNIKYGTNLGIAGTNSQTGQPIIVDRNTNQVVNNTNGSATVTQTGAAGATGTAGPNAQAQERAGANLTAMNKDIQDNLVPEARKADQQVNTINEMFSILKEPGNERVFGIYNGVMEGSNARDKKLFSDFIAGKVVAGSPEYEDFRRRYSELGLTEDQVGVLRRMDALSAAGVGASVRELTGNVGISNQDVKIAQRNNVSVGEWPMLAAYSQLNYQRFEADLKRARAEWAADNIDRFPNSAAMDKAWRSESAQIRKDSDAVSEARAKYIRGYQSLGPTEKAAKIKQAYELYPPPRYQDGEWRNRRTGNLSSMTTRE